MALPITLLDIIVLGVMLLSGLLAMIRGFMREILSIAAWGAAALATLYAYPRLTPMAKTYFNNDTVAAIAVVAGVFIGTLVIATIITARISDMVLDSRIGALDRTLGFLFGLARGLLIVVVAFLFFAWLVPDKQQPDWVRSAKSLSVLQSTGNWVMSLLPDDPEGIYQKYKKRKDDEQTESAPAARPASTASASDSNFGYSKTNSDAMKQLIEGKPVEARSSDGKSFESKAAKR